MFCAMSYPSTSAPRWNRPPSDTGHRIYSFWRLSYSTVGWLIALLSYTTSTIFLHCCCGCKLLHTFQTQENSLERPSHKASDQIVDPEKNSTFFITITFQLRFFLHQQNFSFGNPLFSLFLQHYLYTHSSSSITEPWIAQWKTPDFGFTTAIKHLQTRRDQQTRYKRIMVKTPENWCVKKLFLLRTNRKPHCTWNISSVFFSGSLLSINQLSNSSEIRNERSDHTRDTVLRTKISTEKETMQLRKVQVERKAAHQVYYLLRNNNNTPIITIKSRN